MRRTAAMQRQLGDRYTIGGAFGRTDLASRLGNPLFLFHHSFGPYALLNGVRTEATVHTTDAIGTTLFDYRQRRVVTTPQHGLAFGAPQMPSITNLCQDSHELEDDTWVKVRCNVTPNAIAGPDGLTTADKLYDDSNPATTHKARFGVTKAASNLRYVWAADFKAGERSEFALRMTNGSEAAGVLAFFNLATGSVGSLSLESAGWTAVTSGIIPRDNGWYTCYVIGVSDTDTNINFWISLAGPGESITYSGDGASGLYATNFMAWRGDYYPDIIIPSADATVTRGPDALRWVNGAFDLCADEGSLLIVAAPPRSDPGATEHFCALNYNDSDQNSVRAYWSSGTVQLRGNVKSGGSSQADSAETNYTPSRANPLAFCITWKEGSPMQLYANGNNTQAATVTTAPVNLDRLEVGSQTSSGTRAGFKHYAVAVWPRALSTVEGRQLTRNPNEFVF